MKLPAILLSCLICGPALADSYPVSGSWGQSTGSAKGPIDCGGLRVVTFNGDQRTDSKGGVPSLRNRSVTAQGSSTYRVVEEFSSGQISNATVSYTLRRIDADHIELNMQPGGPIKLQKCK